MERTAFAGLALALAFLVAPACEEEREPRDPAAVTLEEAVAALDRPGQVFYTEEEIVETEGQEPHTKKVWYWGEHRRSRTEAVFRGTVQDATISTPERRTSRDFKDGGGFDDVPPDSPRVPYAVREMFLFGYVAGSQEVEPAVAETEDGRDLLRLHAVYTVEQDGHERVAGMTYTTDAFLDAESLLPVRVEVRLALPGEEPRPPLVVRYRNVRFLDRDELPEDFFDPDALAADEVTLEEAIEIAARQPFKTFWLGQEVPVPWDSPSGQHHETLTLVNLDVPGTPHGRPGEVAMWFAAPPDAAGPMLIVTQSAEPGFTGVAAPLMQAIRTAGNTAAIAGVDGYVYWQYTPAKPCSTEEAQGRTDCRQFADAQFGALVVREGTTIHFNVPVMRGGPGTSHPNINPFNDPDVLSRLVQELRPFGE